MSAAHSERDGSARSFFSQYTINYSASSRPMTHKHPLLPSPSSQNHQHNPLPTPPPSTRPSLDSCPTSPGLFTPLLSTRPSLNPPTFGGTSASQATIHSVVSEIKAFRDDVASATGSASRLVIPNVPDNVCDALEENFPDARLRLTHRTDARTIAVRRCPTEVHECVGKFIGALEPKLQEWVQTHSPNATIDALGASTQDLRGGGRKEPDECFYVSTGGDLPAAPTVVVETGYSERYSELREDVDDWLLRAEPEVRCVIIVWFTPPGVDRGDAMKWVGELEVYERSQVSGKPSLYGERIRFLPAWTPTTVVPAVIPSMQLHIRHFLSSEAVNLELDQELHLSLAGLVDKVTRCLKLTLRKRQRNQQEEEGEGSSKRSRIAKK